MINPLLLFTAQIVSIFSVLLLAVGYLKAAPNSPSARTFFIMTVFIIFYLLRSMTASYIDPQFQLDLITFLPLFTLGISAISGLFMIYCFLIFQEGERFPVPLGISFAVQIFSDFLLDSMARIEDPYVASALFNWSIVLMDIMQLMFVGFAIFWTLKGWRADLVADRRVLQWLIISVQGTLMFVIVFVENFLLVGGYESNANEQALIVFAIALLTLCMLAATLRFDSVSLSNVILKVTEPVSGLGQSTYNIDEDGFKDVFEKEKVYREAGLTISTLARTLNLPEYRLRAFIHKKLGFRNFNAMLHQYRVEDASNLLSDSESSNVPVLTIALSVGYQSITPFNNAFRKIKGVTPSEYRKQRRRS